MPRGGARNGAGRRKGGQNKKTKDRRKVADAAVQLGVEPIDIMLEVMRMRYEAKDWDAAFEAAKECAPYTTPKLAAITQTIKGKMGIELELVEVLYDPSIHPKPTTIGDSATSEAIGIPTQ